jgi:hypothetical protein
MQDQFLANIINKKSHRKGGNLYKQLVRHLQHSEK